MRSTSLLLAALLSLAGCGDGSDAPALSAGSGGEAGTDSGTGGDGEAGSAGQDAQVPDAEADSQGEAATPECSLGLTSEEKQLIESGDAATKMVVVTNQTPEGDAFLHQIACPLDPAEPDLPLLLARMRTTLAATGSGVGIAGPQVGLSRRLFLAQRADLQGSPVNAYINPAITLYSPETASGTEGCLSVPGKSGKVTRSLIVVVDYVGEDGVPVTGESVGSLTDATAKYSARIMQHEYDHLDGILYIDK